MDAQDQRAYEEVKAHIARELAAFVDDAARARGAAQVMVGVHPLAEPADLTERLRRLGATPARAWLQLARATTSAPPPLPSIEVREVGPDQLGTFMDVFSRGFGMPEDLLPLARGSFQRAGWHTYLAYRDGQAVGCASLGVFGALGWLGNATTLPEQRRQGVQAALIARRVQDAGALGARTVITQVAEDLPEKPNPSEHNMRRAGFVTAYRRPNVLLPTA